ncbi:uncharacterized protein LOC120630840 [Pararge aegeria]|nr:uncharacterized protein LOC120630840 [Pararge aegeria]
MTLVLFTVALVGVAFCSPVSRYISNGPAIIDGDSSISLGGAIIDDYEAVMVDPTIVDDSSSIYVGPPIIVNNPPISVAPAIIDETSPISVGPAFFNENMSVGPANIEGAISGDGAVGHTLYQFIINIGEMNVRGANMVADDETGPISVGPAIVDDTSPILVGPAIVDETSPISVGPAIVDDTNSISVGPAIIDESPAFDRSGPMTAGNAKVVGAISGKKAIGHTLCQFIINVDKVNTDERFLDLSQFPLSRINCDNIVDKWGPQ